MIAFSREASESEHQMPRPILIVGPQIITQQTIGKSQTGDVSTRIPELVVDDLARLQQELAMLQRALVRCDLI